jgi:hypothetical protein
MALCAAGEAEADPQVTMGAWGRGVAAPIDARIGLRQVNPETSTGHRHQSADDPHSRGDVIFSCVIQALRVPETGTEAFDSR